MPDEPIRNDLAVLAPAPSTILRAALAEAKPEAAFGSDLDSLWGHLDPGRYRVLIYESHLDPTLGELGATFEGVIERWMRYEDTDAADRAYRPRIADETDSVWAYWWFVPGLRARPILSFRSITPAGREQPPLTSAFIPHGPLLVDVAGI